MNNERRLNWLIPLSLLLGAVALVWWLDQRQRTAPEAHLEHPQNADYYVLNATITQTSEQGEPAYKMTAERVLYFPDRHSTMEVVHATSLGGADSNWDLKADEGWVSPDRDRVDLTGNVVMHGELGDEPVVVKSTAISIYPNDERITSDQPVEIDGDRHHTTAIGMRGEFNARKLELLADVETTVIQE